MVNSILSENEFYLKKYFSDNEGNLNIDLIKLVSYENEAYNIFKAYHYEVVSNNFIFNSQVLLDKIIAKQINEVPVWRKVNVNFIVESNSHVPIVTIKNIIFRFSGDDKARQQAELIATLDPNNTLIIQVDAKRKQYFIEHGKLAAFQQQNEQDWFLLGHVSLTGEKFSGLDSHLLAKALLTLKEKFVLDNPQEVCIFSTTTTGQNTSPDNANWIASGVAKQLSATAIDTIITFYTQRKGFLVNENLLNHNASFINCRYDSATKQILLNGIPITQSLLMSIALKEVPVWQAASEYSFYLQNYFANERNGIDINKLKQVFYDPIISKKVNNYFGQNQHIFTNAMANWQLIFIKDTQLSLWQQAHELSSLPDAINCDQSVLHNLSDQSRWILKQYFPLG
ncbi:MAG: C80 family cysteine peptidase [Candidatus Arsenophonus phytopathogenicus]